MAINSGHGHELGHGKVKIVFSIGFWFILISSHFLGTVLGQKCKKFAILKPSATEKLPNSYAALKNPKYQVDYSSCSLSGDSDGPNSGQAAFDSYVEFLLRGQILPFCIMEAGTNKTALEICQDDFDFDLRDLMQSFPTYTAQEVRTNLCAGLKPSNLKRVAIKKDLDAVLSQIKGDRQVEALMEYLVDPDWGYHACRAVDTNMVPPCELQKSCGYFIGIDFAPLNLVDWFGKICSNVLGARQLVTDGALYNQFELLNLREDCANADFLTSFNCITVNVTLRRKLKAYMNFYLDQKDKMLKPFNDKLLSTMKMQSAALLENLSKRHKYKILKVGGDCSGSIDFEDFWARTVTWFKATPDGTFPFDFINSIPVPELELVSYLKKTCDLSKDLVCGGKCTCECPKKDKWRKCNGSAVGRMFGNVGLIAVLVMILIININ